MRGTPAWYKALLTLNPDQFYSLKHLEEITGVSKSTIRRSLNNRKATVSKVKIPNSNLMENVYRGAELKSLAKQLLKRNN